MSRPITQATLAGRMLIALRAGTMTTDELTARFGAAAPTTVVRLCSAGLVDRRAGVGHDVLWRLTSTGHSACPCRRDPVTPPYMSYGKRKPSHSQPGA